MIKRLYVKFRETYIKNKYIIKYKLHILGKVYISNPNIKFGKNVTIYQGAQIWGNGEIKIGDNVAIGKDTIIFATESITIENDVSIAAQCYIIDSDHSIERNQLINKQKLISAPIEIKQDVWIGAGSKILKGSKIEQGAVIGAMSLVKGKIDPYSINVGIPAKKIKERI